MFVRPNGGRVVLGESAVSVLARHRQLQNETPEAGGVLLGRRVVDSNDVIVDVASEPTAQDVRRRFRFFRHVRPAQALVDAAWAESRGTRNYLGDWHSHPEDDPTPSCIDRTNWRRIASRTVCEQEFLVFVIVGRVRTGVWEVSRPKGQLTALTEAAVDYPRNSGSSVGSHGE